MRQNITFELYTLSKNCYVTKWYLQRNLDLGMFWGPSDGLVREKRTNLSIQTLRMLMSTFLLKLSKTNCSISNFQVTSEVKYYAVARTHISERKWQIMNERIETSICFLARFYNFGILKIQFGNHDTNKHFTRFVFGLTQSDSLQNYDKTQQQQKQQQ